MALDTYSGLKTSIASFLNRDDLTDTIPDFIRLAEAQMARDIRHWRMHERATTTLASRYTTRPGDWIETIRLTIATVGYRELRLVSMADMARRRAEASDVAGVPAFFTYSQDEIEVFPTPDQSYTGELIYFQDIAALSDSNTANWLLTAAPDVYLYGSLIHSAPFLNADARTSTWASFYQAAVSRLNAESEDSQFGSQTMAIGAPV